MKANLCIIIFFTMLLCSTILVSQHNLFTNPVNEKSFIVQDFQVNENIEFNKIPQVAPSICSDSCGNFVITWMDWRNGNYDIYAQRFTNYGNASSVNFKVNDDLEAAKQEQPAIACSENGEFVITWQDQRNGDDDIYAQRYSRDGIALDGNFKVNDTTGSAVQYCSPGIASRGNGDFIITWLDERNGVADIYAQRYTSDGNKLGLNFKVNDDKNVPRDCFPDIFIDNDGDFVIVWWDRRNGNNDIYAQRYSNDGNIIGPNFKVSDDPGTWNQGYVAIAGNKNGDFVIGWSDNREGAFDIYAQCYSRDGQAKGSNFKVNDIQKRPMQAPPSIGVAENGSFVITWDGSYNEESNIYAQLYNNEGFAEGPNFKVNFDPQNADQFDPSLAIHSNGEFVITWQDSRYGSWDIFAQRYDPYTNPIKSNFKVNDDDGNAEQESPSIAANNNGEFTITWHDNRNLNYDIYAQHYSDDGNPIGLNFKVNDDQENADQIDPCIAENGAGNIVITWQDERNGNPDIYAQRFSSNNEALGSNFKVNDDSGVEVQYAPSVSSGEHGDFVITWMDDRNGNFDVYAQCYDSDGVKKGMNFKVNDDPGAALQFAPSVSSDDSGNFVIAWPDLRHELIDIYTQAYSNDGTPIGSNIKVNTNQESFNNHSSSISVDVNGNFVIAWIQEHNEDYDVYAQRYSGDGNVRGDNFKVNDSRGDSINLAYTRYNSTTSSFDRDGNFIITWTGSNAGNVDIYAQCYTSDGNKLGSNFRIPNTTEQAQFAPDVALHNGRIYTTWADERGGFNKAWDFNIWTNILDWNNLVAVHDKQPHSIASEFILYPNYPNPFNAETVISYQLPVLTAVELSIYNNAGQKVTTLVSGKQQAGSYHVTWDANDVASGIYICRLVTGTGDIQSQKLIYLK